MVYGRHGVHVLMDPKKEIALIQSLRMVDHLAMGYLADLASQVSDTYMYPLQIPSFTISSHLFRFSW